MLISYAKLNWDVSSQAGLLDHMVSHTISWSLTWKQTNSVSFSFFFAFRVAVGCGSGRRFVQYRDCLIRNHFLLTSLIFDPRPLSCSSSCWWHLHPHQHPSTTVAGSVVHKMRSSFQNRSITTYFLSKDLNLTLLSGSHSEDCRNIGFVAQCQKEQSSKITGHCIFPRYCKMSSLCSSQRGWQAWTEDVKKW